MYTGWELDRDTRDLLLLMFPPLFPDVIAHHITLTYGVGADAVPPPNVEADVVGVASGDGVQALVVSVDGSVVRPDKGIFHITWSIDRSAGRKPVDAKLLLDKHVWRTLSPYPIFVRPRVFRT